MGGGGGGGGGGGTAKKSKRQREKRGDTDKVSISNGNIFLRSVNQYGYIGGEGGGGGGRGRQAGRQSAPYVKVSQDEFGQERLWP